MPATPTVPTANPLSLLRQYWGHQEFRPGQQEIIEAVLAGRDVLALLPTGGGKSVCFQVPALARPGLCVVVTPLIALMRDQVENLRKRGLKAEAVYAGMSHQEIDQALDNCVYGREVKFLYVSPERLLTDLFQARVARMSVGLLAIDEAHCLSQWGYDFRPPYLRIAELRALLLPEVPCIALTATATGQVRQDIVEKLTFRPGYGIFTQSFARPKLSYSVLLTEDKQRRLLEVLRGVGPGKTGIVYARTRRQAEDTAAWLSQQGLPAAAYHAGLAAEQRTRTQQNWLTDKTRIIVATNAFGMGIDKPDVRVVAHLDAPATLEAYYQEAGRAGRDGLYAFAVLLSGPADADGLRRQAQLAHPPPDVVRRVYQALANYSRTAVGGELVAFDFDLGVFAETYRLKAVEAYRALKVLEQQGFVQLTEAVNQPARVQLISNQEDLYRFQVANAQHDLLIKALLRMYGGELFVAFQGISESTLARHLRQSTTDVTRQLRYLHGAGVLHYQPRRELPQALFTTPRYDAAQLPLDERRLKAAKQLTEHQTTAVIDYAAGTTQCRQQTLLDYFDEPDAPACGVCDVCLARKKARQAPESAAGLQAGLLELLRAAPLLPRQVAARYPTAEAAAVTAALRGLVELGQLAYAADGRLGVK